MDEYKILKGEKNQSLICNYSFNEYICNIKFLEIKY